MLLLIIGLVGFCLNGPIGILQAFGFMISLTIVGSIVSVIFEVICGMCVEFIDGFSRKEKRSE